VLGRDLPTPGQKKDGRSTVMGKEGFNTELIFITFTLFFLSKLPFKVLIRSMQKSLNHTILWNSVCTSNLNSIINHSSYWLAQFTVRTDGAHQSMPKQKK
jgi:hypothetical protein